MANENLEQTKLETLDCIIHMNVSRLSFFLILVTHSTPKQEKLKKLFFLMCLSVVLAPAVHRITQKRTLLSSFQFSSSLNCKKINQIWFESISSHSLLFLTFFFFLLEKSKFFRHLTFTSVNKTQSRHYSK